MALKFYYDYKLELLAEQFAGNVYNKTLHDLSAAALLQSHTVVVQTRGMAEFLRQYLAEKSGIAVNLDMPFLNSFVNRILTDLYGEEFKNAAFRSAPENMRNIIMPLLCSDEYVQNNLPELLNYTTGSNAELKRWQLAGAIAGVFDQYQLYRSGDKLQEMFAKAGRNNAWQKVLYDQLFNETTPGRSHFFQRFAGEALTPAQKKLLPQSLTVFGVGAMPPEYLNFFIRLSEYCQVNFFYLTPCMEYWADQKSPREKRPEAWEITESGNPLLQNLGRQGRSFFSCLMNYDEIFNQMESEFPDGPDSYPADSTLLEIMQYDIRYLYDRRDNGSNSDSDTVHVGSVVERSTDNSIAIHNCHSLRRELEVLHDELLKLINQGTDPSSIIVMAPDIEACAPVIHAVFGNGELANVYSIADMQPSDHAMAWTAFKGIFELAASRFEYTSVMSLLSLPIINSVLKLENGELLRFGELIYRSGARWGFDENMHEKFCGKKFEEFSWRQAIDRLLAGFANRSSSGETSAIAGNCKVMEALSMAEIESFARLVNMLEKLEELSHTLIIDKTINEWCGLFERVMDDFFAGGNNERTALAGLRAALRKLKNNAAKGFIPGKYPLNTALIILNDHIGSSGENGRFLRGKITFCHMTPMRSIPMDTVAILDLNEGVFPRKKTDLGFDLIPLLPAPGDRSLTAQDRYLLLEALMAARKNLLLFYQGQNPRDGSEMPPCAPLAEIMSCLEAAFKLKEYKHKVSGISEEYYKPGAKHPSFNQENYLALKHLQEYSRKSAEPEEPAAAVKPGDFYKGWHIQNNITIYQLVDFFSNPCKWYMKNQFNISFSDSSECTSDDEPWKIDSLDKYIVKDMVMNMRLKNFPEEDIYIHANKSNILPPVRVGKKIFDEISSGIADLPEFWQQAFPSMLHLPAVYSSPDKNYTVSGMVNTTPDQQYVLVFNWGNYKSKHALDALFGALTLSAMAAAENRSVKVGAKIINLNSQNVFECRQLEPIETAEAVMELDKLIALAGSEHAGPLPLFEKSSAYYQDPKTVFDKFANGDHCDLANPAVARFFTADMWDDEDFSNEFNFYAAELYSRITKDGDNENAGN